MYHTALIAMVCLPGLACSSPEGVKRRCALSLTRRLVPLGGKPGSMAMDITSVRPLVWKPGAPGCGAGLGVLLPQPRHSGLCKDL